MTMPPLDPAWLPVLAILGMTASTYFMRTAGFWLMGHVALTPRVRRMLDALPGSIVMAIIVPLAMKSGLPAFAAGAAVIASMLIRRNEFFAVAAGLAAASAVRAFGL